MYFKELHEATFPIARSGLVSVVGRGRLLMSLVKTWGLHKEEEVTFSLDINPEAAFLGKGQKYFHCQMMKNTHVDSGRENSEPTY